MPNNISQQQIYQSYSMYHPDGTLMCHCNARKAKWYINRDLATWIGDKAFKLKFAPAGHGKSDKPYYTQTLENRCVVCGRLDNLNKHHVFPYVFRSRMPSRLKRSNHHDILAICTDCHEAYENYATLLKEEFAQKYGTSINQDGSVAAKTNSKIIAARKLLEKLDAGNLKDGNGNLVMLPPDRLELLRERAAKPFLDSEEKPEFWADTIMRNILQEDSLKEFVVFWRKHFIEYAKPQFLPNHWSVDSELELSNK